MKKLLLIIAFAFIGCTTDEVGEETECNCTIEGKRYISDDAGYSWHYNRTEDRTGMQMPCWYDGLETNQIYGDDGIWFKTVWICKD